MSGQVTHGHFECAEVWHRMTYTYSAGKTVIESEISSILDFTLFILKTFGFYLIMMFYLSTMPEKYVGTLENWKPNKRPGTGALRKRAVIPGRSWRRRFYGPKIDIKIKDSLNRSRQCSTPVDFNNPERFDVTRKRWKRPQAYNDPPLLMGHLKGFSEFS